MPTGFRRTHLGGGIGGNNTCFRSYTDDEALSKYGAGFIGSQPIFVADNFGGEFRLTNVLIHGGGRGIAIYADTRRTIPRDPDRA